MNKKLTIFLMAMFCCAMIKSTNASSWVDNCKPDRVFTFIDVTKANCDVNGDKKVTAHDTAAMFKCVRDIKEPREEAERKMNEAKKAGNTQLYNHYFKIWGPLVNRHNNIHIFATRCSRQFGLFDKSPIEELGIDEIVTGKYDETLFGNDQTVCRSCLHVYEILKAMGDKDPRWGIYNHKFFGLKPEKGKCTAAGVTPYTYTETGAIKSVKGIVCDRDKRVAEHCAKYSEANQIKARANGQKFYKGGQEYCTRYHNCKSAGGTKCERLKQMSNTRYQLSADSYKIANGFFRLCKIGSEQTLPATGSCQ